MSTFRIFLRSAFFLISLLGFQILFAQEAKDIYASGIQLEGKINNKYAIEMHLSGDDLNGFFHFDSDECRDLKGNYFYKSEVKPISLIGKICPGKNIVLTHRTEGEEKERFVGEWDGAKQTITGTWKILSSGKTMPFELNSVNLRFRKGEKLVFPALLKAELATEEGDWAGYQYAIADIYGDNKGATIKDLQVAAGGITHFSPTRLEFVHNYSNAGHGTDTEEIFQLLANSNGIYALKFISNISTESLEGEEDEACDFAFQLYQYQHLEWVEIDLETGALRFPDSFPVIGRNCSDGMPVILSDGIGFGSRKFDWKGDRFVLREGK